MYLLTFLSRSFATLAHLHVITFALVRCALHFYQISQVPTLSTSYQKKCYARDGLDLAETFQFTCSNSKLDSFIFSQHKFVHSNLSSCWNEREWMVLLGFGNISLAQMGITHQESTCLYATTWKLQNSITNAKLQIQLTGHNYY